MQCLIFVFLFFTHERKNEIWNWTFFFVLQHQKWKTKINSFFNFCFCDSKLKYENRFHILISIFVNKKIKKPKLTRFSYFDLLFWNCKQKTSRIWFFSISAQNWKSNDTKSPYIFYSASNFLFCIKLLCSASNFSTLNQTFLYTLNQTFQPPFIIQNCM